MSDYNADIILHPIRLRIIQALAGQELTASQLRKSLNDVPQATLYRHLKKLTESNFVEIVREEKAHSNLEAVYTVSQFLRLNDGDVENATHADHMRFFTAFVATFLTDFEQYLNQQDTVNYSEDGVVYNKITLFLTDDELATMKAELQAIFMKYAGNTPSQERRTRMFGNIWLPGDTGTKEA